MTYRNFMLTMYHNLKDHCNKLRHDLDLSEIRYCIWQIEVCPETKRYHIQAYLETTKGRRFSWIKTYFNDATIHVERRKTSRIACREYCSKELSRHRGPYEFGKFVSQDQKRTREIDDIVEATKSGETVFNLDDRYPRAMCFHHRGIERYRKHIIRATVPDWREVVCKVYYGPTRSGKTSKAIRDGGGFRQCFILKPPRKGGDIWWDGYDGQKTIILDDFYGWIRIYDMLNILDNYPRQIEVKCGMTVMAWDNVIITSNKAPISWYPKLMTDENSPILDALLARIREVWRIKDGVATLSNYFGCLTEDVITLERNEPSAGELMARSLLSAESDQDQQVSVSAIRLPSQTKPSSN